MSLFSPPAPQGTSSDQDNRFSDKEKKLLKQMKFEEVLATKIDMRRVKLDVLKPWIAKRVAEILGIEDDVVVEFIFNQLEDEKEPDPKKIQINLTGFLNGKNARVFMGELWGMLASAQKNESGIPQALLEQKKEELKGRRVSRAASLDTCHSHAPRITLSLQGEAERLQDNLRRLAEEDGGGAFGRRGRSREREREHSRRSKSRERERERRGRRSRSKER